MKHVKLTNQQSIEIRNIYCVGRNYAKHIAELSNERPDAPVLFLKSSTSARGCQPEPMGYQEIFSHELELVFLIKNDIALGGLVGWDDVAGIGLGLDLTRRSCQEKLKAKGLPWAAAKSFAGAAVLSDFLPLDDFYSPEDLSFFLEVNGQLRQEGRSKEMIYQPLELLNYLASMQTLSRGDLIFTGTPEGVGPIEVGDRFRMGFRQPEICFDGQL